MKILEFQTHLNPDQTLTVPLSVARQIQADDDLQVVLLVPDAEEDRSWANLTAAQFLQDYSKSDAMYDRLSTR